MSKKERPIDKEGLERIFKDGGFDDFKWIAPDEIVVAQWVRMKCMFGCVEYGKRGCCPPATPPLADCERFFREYETAAVLHFSATVEKPEDRHAWTGKISKRLTALEREVFLAGNPKAFVLHVDSCTLCEECPGSREECKNKKRARPGPEAMAVDVFTTVRKVGFPISVLTDYGKEMNRYAFLMID